MQNLLKATWMVAARTVAALLFTVATVAVLRIDIEVAIYGTEGTLKENVRPRLVGGWPSPFLADDPGTSVTFKLGIEDQFRPSSFLADLAFWYIVIGVITRVIWFARSPFRRRSL